MFVLGAIFIVRLFYVQVIQHEYYANQAEEEHISKYTIPATRGLIYAKDGTSGYAPLVLNETVYTVYADPTYVDDASKVAEVMRNVAGGNTVGDFETGLNDKELRYTILARQVSKTQKELIEEEDLSGVGFQEESKRVYTEGQLAAQVLGFVNSEGEGQYGIEGAMNTELAGTDGQLKAVTDVNGIPLSVSSDNIEAEPVNGQNIVLTIDRGIQNKAEQLLKSGLENANATKGSIIVMDPDSGSILAMVNYPTYDPSDYGSVDDYTIFSNRAISDPYEPGSIIKALTMGVGLNVGVITPTTTYNNTGSVQVQDAKISNVATSPTGSVTMTQVLQYSFNTGVVQVLKWLGGDDDINDTGKQILYDYFTGNYFFDKKTGVQLAGEASGEIISPSDEQGGDVRYANMTFGQGMNATMLQVISAFSAAINGGVYYSPQIISGYLSDDTETFTAVQPAVKKTDTLSPASSASLRQMLHDARKGSTVSAGEKSGYYIGGKTGTAQVYDETTGTYSETSTIGSYIGYGGGSAEDPEYVIMVRVDDAHTSGFSGSAAAAPIFTELSNWMLEYLQIQPES